jgi:dTDP-4-dehydrorhamnose reductase
VRGLGHSRAGKHPYEDVIQCDLLEKKEIEAQFHSFSPSVVIHSAAERRPDRLEGKKDYAMRINAEVTADIARLCKQFNIWMIYLSTNYVFDGKDAPYSEDAMTNPLSVYGLSKLEGEHAVQKESPESASLRVPLLFGPLEYLGESSVTALLDSVTSSAPKFDHWQQRYPTSSEDVAEVLEAFSTAYLDRGRKSPNDFSGVFHWQGNACHTKYSMAVTIAEIAGLGHSHFIPNTAAPKRGPRPQYESMLCTRLERLLGIEDDPKRYRQDFKECLQRYIQPFIETDKSEDEGQEDVVGDLQPAPSVQREPPQMAMDKEESMTSQVSLSARPRKSLSGDLEGLKRNISLGMAEADKAFAQRAFQSSEHKQMFEDHVHDAVGIDG